MYVETGATPEENHIIYSAKGSYFTIGSDISQNYSNST